MRPDVNTYYLNIAKAVSARSTCLRRQYGAVIVNNDEIISTGYNGGMRGGVNCCDNNYCPRMNLPHNSGDYGSCHGVHAEQNAIISASRQEMIGATLYLSGVEDGNDIIDVEPCPICKKMMRNAGITKLVTITGCVNI
jgi:dCMP deaminase